ncbi:MAG TPA: hypothetical protein PKV24_21480, partial [Cyclobacteriaceae bacterium]|nr:hypothetical protein [Cyclobacteriaceae bacterium]
LFLNFVAVTKQELKLALQTAGIYNPPYAKNHPLWIEALERYKVETKDLEVSLSCGSCYNKIKNWLEK